MSLVCGDKESAANLFNDRIEAKNYYQNAEHYFRSAEELASLAQKAESALFSLFRS